MSCGDAKRERQGSGLKLEDEIRESVKDDEHEVSPFGLPRRTLKLDGAVKSVAM